MSYEPWIPTLWDIECLKEKDDYYKSFGFDQLVVDAHFSRLIEQIPRLTERFNARYATRRVNSETLEQWQLRLQAKLDEIAVIYDRAYRIYADKDAELTVDLNSSTESVTTSSVTDRRADAPDSIINANGDYADTRSDTTSDDVTKVTPGGALIDVINSGIDRYRSLDADFISEFENNFLNVFWY